MKLCATDYDILSYLLKTKALSYDEAIEWAYSKYKNDGVDPFIENLSLASDVSEMLLLISNKFQVYGEPSQEFLAGEVAMRYSSNKMPLQKAIARILYDLDLKLPEGERQELYIADDCFGWHENAENEALLHVSSIFEKYKAIYVQAVSAFCA